MPKRWEHELLRLHDVDAPVGKLRARAAEPPQDDGSSSLPPTRQRVVAGIVAFGVFAVAASFGWQAFRPSGGTTLEDPSTETGLIIELPEPPAGISLGARGGLMAAGVPKPAMTVSHAGTERKALLVGYSWCDAQGECDGASADYSIPGFVVVPAGAPIVIESAATDVSGSFDPVGRNRALVSLESGAVPGDPGQYELLVDANYPQGYATFSIGVDVVELSAPLSSLVGTEWRLTHLDGQPIDEDADRLAGASIRFGDRMIGGWSGCNSFGGRYRIEGTSMTVPGIGGTEVGPCSGERKWFDRIQGDTTWISDGSSLTVEGPMGSFTARRVGVVPVDVLRVECLPGTTQVLDPEVLATDGRVDAILGPAGHAIRVVLSAGPQNDSAGEVVALLSGTGSEE